MNSVVFNETYQVDLFGFLDPAEQWDEGFADGMSLDELGSLFPTGYRSGARLMAGLPAPTS